MNPAEQVQIAKEAIMSAAKILDKGSRCYRSGVEPGCIAQFGHLPVQVGRSGVREDDRLRGGGSPSDLRVEGKIGNGRSVAVRQADRCL